MSVDQLNKPGQGRSCLFQTSEVDLLNDKSGLYRIRSCTRIAFQYRLSILALSDLTLHLEYWSPRAALAHT